MPTSPYPPARRRGGAGESSMTSTVMSFPSRVTPMATVAAWAAWRATLVSDSWTTR
jgi:hypothetical protein